MLRLELYELKLSLSSLPSLYLTGALLGRSSSSPSPIPLLLAPAGELSKGAPCSFGFHVKMGRRLGGREGGMQAVRKGEYYMCVCMCLRGRVRVEVSAESVRWEV